MKIKTKSFNLSVYQKGNKDAKRIALVLPGKLDTKDYPHMLSHVDYLADRGYLALSFDPAGTWESDGDISLYSMTNYLRAINELIEYFGNKPTFVIGHSRGGSMALLAGTTNKHITHFGAIMSWYSFDPKVKGSKQDLEWKESGFKESKRDLPNDPTKFRSFSQPYSFQEDQEQYDMLADLEVSNKPKLFILGDADETVKPEVVKNVYLKAKDPKMLYELKSGHNYRLSVELIKEVNNAIGAFLDKFVK
jgi:pimeloyl-ACP methyl ester carboxylesterase